MGSSRASVLVVDGDRLAREAVAEALRGADLVVETAASADEALTRAVEQPPGVVLVDVAGDAPEDLEPLRALRRAHALGDVPIFAFVRRDADGAVARAFSEGADDVLARPVRAAELLARVQHGLGSRARIDAAIRREHDAHVVLELSQALGSSLDVRDILFTVVRRTAEVAGVDRCSIVVVRDPGDLGVVLATSDDEDLQDLPIDLDRYPEIRQVMGSGQPLVIEDAATHPLLEVVRQTQNGAPFASIAILPILADDRRLGVLFLRARHPVGFGPRELSLYRTIASTTGLALRNARMLQSLRDQTARIGEAHIEAEKRLVALQRYADFFESAAEGIAVIDLAGKVLFANARAREITGWDEGALRSAHVRDFLTKEERARVRTLRSGFEHGFFPRGLDLRLHRRSGREVIVNASFNALLRESDAVVFTFRDVTQERATAAELQHTKDFLERVIDSSVDAIISADLRGTVLLYNRAAERCYGHRAADVVGKMSVEALYPPGVAREVMRLIRDPAHSGPGRLEGYRCEVLSRTGERIPVSLSAALLYEDGKPAGSVGVFSDLRDRVRMEARLAAAQAELQSRERQAIVAELAGAAAHELNQPLTSVSGYAALLKRKLEPGTSAFAAAEIIADEAARMAEIVRKIGTITRYETKEYVGQAKILDLDRASDGSQGASATDGARDEPEGESG